MGLSSSRAILDQMSFLAKETCFSESSCEKILFNVAFCPRLKTTSSNQVFLLQRAFLASDTQNCSRDDAAQREVICIREQSTVHSRDHLATIYLSCCKEPHFGSNALTSGAFCYSSEKARRVLRLPFASSNTTNHQYSGVFRLETKMWKETTISLPEYFCMDSRCGWLVSTNKTARYTIGGRKRTTG